MLCFYKVEKVYFSSCSCVHRPLESVYLQLYCYLQFASPPAVILGMEELLGAYSAGAFFAVRWAFMKPDHMDSAECLQYLTVCWSDMWILWVFLAGVWWCLWRSPLWEAWQWIQWEAVAAPPPGWQLAALPTSLPLLLRPPKAWSTPWVGQAQGHFRYEKDNQPR